MKADTQPGFLRLLRQNRNYRWTWTGQVVSEVGDNFNNIAVFALALQNTGSGMVVAAVMLSRALPAILAGPVAGVALDRMDRRHLMIASDLVRAVVAACFIFAIPKENTWLLYPLSAALMFASPFFTSGRSAILPSIATKDELHTANALTQTTQWLSVTVGAFLGGTTVGAFGYHLAFFFNALSFLWSAFSIWRLQAPPGGYRANRDSLTELDVARPWKEYAEGLRYMKQRPLILGIGLVGVGWATGGGAAQILFSLFGEIVFKRGPQGIGILWGFSGLGLVIGALFAHRYLANLSFEGYKRAISISYLVHGGSYVLFSQMPRFEWAVFFISLSRAAVAVSSVLNMTQLLSHVNNEYRGRVFSTNETMTWATMMLSLGAAGFASEKTDPRTIGAVAGVLSSLTGVFWAWANATGRLPEPPRAGVHPEDVEVHGDPVG